ncbi:MAG: hypothetical protein P9X24_02150 [Candidatus Hatepunaea meridiana]|nr:hypothetical protein [Candidatus Hatepunaea meridiana]
MSLLLGGSPCEGLPGGSSGALMMNPSTHIYAWAMAIQAASKQSNYDCILVPSEIADMAAKKHGESIKVGTAVSQGAFDKLTMKQLQKLAQSNSISIARTKKDFIKLLKPLEPDVDLESLKGTQLKVLIKKHKIGALRSKEELIALLKKKAAEKAKQEVGKELVEQQIKVLKQKITLHLNQLPGLQPQDFKLALNHFEKISDALSEAKSLLPEIEWSVLKQQYDYARSSFHEMVKTLKGKDLKTIAKQAKLHHYQWASKDDLIILMTSDDPVAIKMAKDNIEGKWAKWAEKHSKKSQVPKPVTTPTAVKPPKPLSHPSNFTNSDETWEKFSKSNPFSYQGRADIEGAHTKYFFTDKSGDKWLFKPVSEEFRGYGDEVAYRIGRLIDPDAIEVRYIDIEVPGRGKLKGSIQKWRTDLKKEFDFRSAVVVKLTTSELEGLQREHVIDWLISNHDAHGKQFLRLKNNRLAGIDKGQLFKFLGNDCLSIDYHPNRAFGEHEPFYNTMMRAWRDGKIEMNLQATYKYISSIESITDDAYIDLLKPYAERRFSRQPLKLKQFYETALNRKNNLKKDFEDFYTELLRKRTKDKKVVFHFDVDGKELVVGKAAKGYRHIPEEAEILVKEAKESGWQGKSLPVDVDDIEDQNVLLYTEKVKSKTRTVMRMKIRPEAEKKLLASLSTGPGDTIGQAAGKALADDLFYNDILAAVKSINYHIKQGDFNFNKSKIDQALSHRAALIKLTGKQDRDLKSMPRAYLKTLDKIDASVSASGRTKIGAFKQYLKKEKPIKPSGDKIPTVKRTTVYGDRKVVRKGEINVTHEKVTLGDLHSNFTAKGLEYKIDLGDGVEGIYRPWITENYYSHQGQLELRILSDCTPESAERLLDGLERLGIGASFASPVDAEYMYLLKQAFILNEDSTPAWKKIIKSLDTQQASKAKRVKDLRQYWSDRLGVKDVTQIPGYDPQGKYSIMSSAWKKKKEAGYRHQLRFDISDEQVKRELGDYGLYHRLTNGSDIATVLDQILDHNGALISTVEKMRVGIPVGGMSPSSDMGTGGASYFFTRIRKLPGVDYKRGETGFYFKPHLLRRMDAITYESDKFGRVTGNHVRQHRKVDISDYKSIASRKSSNETIFKNEVTLLDNLQLVTVSNETAKRKVLNVFRKHGVTRLPDGRQVKDIIRTVN